MTQTTDSLTTALTGALPFILILAAVLTLPISFGLLWLYRRAVLRSMRAQTNPAIHTLASSPHPAASYSIVQPVPDPVTSHSDASPSHKLSAQTLYARLRRGPLLSATVYASAGSVYAVILAVTYLVATKNDFSLLRFLTLFWIYVWPVVLAVNIVAMTTRRARLAFASLYFFLFALFGALALARSSTLSVGQIVTLWLIDNSLPTALLLAFLTWRVRAVGPLIFTFMVLTLTGSIVTVFGAGSFAQLLRAVVVVGDTLGLGASSDFVALAVLGFAVFALVGWLALRWIRTRYEGKQLSDQSLTLDGMWLLFSIVYPINFAFEGAWWILSGLAAFAVYKSVITAGFSLLASRARTMSACPMLLLLRVFALGKRSEQLFAALTTYWRYGGGIRFIAGPDLLTTTVEPHEFLDFVSGKLARRFIDGRETFNLRLSEEDHIPDHDSRFRVNDFFCHDSTWQMVLSGLVNSSQVVLMDLRGFSQKNDGCVFEINELVKVAPLDRAVFVIDETTDERFLQQIVQQAWEQMPVNSPNREFPLERFRPFRFEGTQRNEFRQLLQALCHAATVA